MQQPVYGDRRDYPKIDLYVEGKYDSTTTWADSLHMARYKLSLTRNIDIDKISANYQNESWQTEFLP